MRYRQITIKIHHLLFIFVLSTLPNCIHAQEHMYIVTGFVTNQKKEPIAFGSAIALSKKDSSMIKGIAFTNGLFKLNAINTSSFLLKISSLGLKDTVFTVVNKAQDSLINLGSIVLSINGNNTLSEISVSNKTSLFENDGEKIKVNVENTSLSALGSALDVLRRSPGILVNSSDNVSVFGRGSAVIYLDGQAIASMDVLNGLPSAEIKYIEIINNPSAKYDAAGRAVINIHTRRSILMGYNGNAWGNVKYSKYFTSFTAVNFNYRNRKHTISLAYGLSKGTTWLSDDYIRKFKSNDTLLNVMNNHIYEKQNLGNLHYFRVGYAYKLDSNSTIDIRYNGFHKKAGTTTDNENKVTQNEAPIYSLKTASLAKPLMINQTASLNYTRKLDTLGSDFFTAFQYTDFYSDNPSYIQQHYISDANSTFQKKKNRNKNSIAILTFQADLDKAFSKRWRLTSGVKNSYIARTGEVKFDNYNTLTEDWIPDPFYYNGFSYKENIIAGYSELKFKHNKLNLRAGLRAEQTHSDGFSKKMQQQIILRNYLNLFPNAFVGYDISKDLTTGLTYSSRIARPAFQDMDPFINYIDSLSSFQGNPLLKPEFTTSIEGRLIYKKEASLTFGYSRTTGALRLVVDKLTDGSEVFVASTKNLEWSESYNAGITIPYELSWWTTSNYIGYSLNSFLYKNNGSQIKNSKPLLYIYLYNEFRFKKIASLEINFEYTSSTVDGIFITKSMSNLSATLKKTFLNDRLIFRFIANDILKSYVTSGISNIPGYDIHFTSRTNIHSFMLSLQYKFGKLKLNDNNKSVGSTEAERIKMSK